jgi:predicted nucleic acid-binding protein
VIVVDASCLGEVFGLIRRLRMMEVIDETTASLAIEDLGTWPGERYGHRALLGRAWELRTTVRGWDAMYVVLAEVLEAPLITLDGRLAEAPGPRCTIELIS